MTRNERALTGQQNTITGSGNIVTGGTFTNSPVTTGPGSRIAVSNTPPSADIEQPWLEQLHDELTRIRLLLAEDHDPERSLDRDDAIEAVTTLAADLPDKQDEGGDEPRRLRLRVKGVIGVLAPVAEIIGGVAALEAIVQHL